MCQIENKETSEKVYNYGVIETYKWPSNDCHEAHRQCRTACRDKLNLQVSDGKGFPKRGYMYCQNYSEVTNNGPLVLQAVWKLHNCPADSVVYSYRTVDLCCGHTTVNINGNNMKVYGWNPDCKSQVFELGKVKH